MTVDLLDAWAAWELDEPPHVLAADREYLSSTRSTRACVTRASWETAYGHQDFGAPGDDRLHLGLLPFPFSGDLRQATIFVLLLNPGVGPTDYYGEYEVPAFRAARIANLRQQFEPEELPFVGLDPRFAWHGGFTYWHAKLRGVIAALAQGWSVSFAEARQRLARELAIVELFPYHSETFRDADHWLRDLPSVALARGFVRETVAPRVLAGQAIAIVTRQAQLWEIPHTRGVVVYSSQQARAAHLTPASPGGTAIISQLLGREQTLRR